MIQQRVIRGSTRAIAQEFQQLLEAAKASGGAIDIRLSRQIDQASEVLRRILSGQFEPPRFDRPGRPGESPPSSSIGPREGGRPPAGPSLADEETPIEVLGRADIGRWPDRQVFESAEVTTPGSSNVYSYFYRADRPDRRGVLNPSAMGTLFVTFRAWQPGQKSIDMPAGGGKTKRGRPFVRGPMYAYSNVPASKYMQFAATAAGSAGSAVWEYLRVRGTQSGHQHPYRLINGSMIPGGGVYVPRKATAAGYQRRAVLGGRSDRQAWQFSTLEPRPFSKAEPRRSFAAWRSIANSGSGGEPNRGTPNTGQ